MLCTITSMISARSCIKLLIVVAVVLCGLLLSSGGQGGGDRVWAAGARTSIGPAPVGPMAPSSGWQVVFADDFNTALGTAAGQDDLWYPNEPWAVSPGSTAVGNTQETEAYSGSQVYTANGRLFLSAKPDLGGGGCWGQWGGEELSLWAGFHYIQRQ